MHVIHKQHIKLQGFAQDSFFHIFLFNLLSPLSSFFGFFFFQTAFPGISGFISEACNVFFWQFSSLQIDFLAQKNVSLANIEKDIKRDSVSAYFDWKKADELQSRQETHKHGIKHASLLSLNVALQAQWGCRSAQYVVRYFICFKNKADF